MPDLEGGGPGSLGSGQGVQGGAGPPRRVVRCLSSVSLLSMEDTGRGSTHDWGLAKQEAFLLWPRFSAIAHGSREPRLPGSAALMPTGAQPRPASRLVQEPGLTMTGQC